MLEIARVYIPVKSRKKVKRDGAAAENEGGVRECSSTTLPHEDLTFVFPALRPYTFPRCFTMCDIITRRPDKLWVSLGID